MDLQVIPYCILDNLTAMLGAWWYLICEALSRTANVLAERFQKVRDYNSGNDFMLS